MLRAVLFDLDGTLFDTEKSYTLFWSGIGRRYYPQMPDFSQQIKGITLKKIFDTFFQDADVAQVIRNELDAFEASMTYTFLPHALDFIGDLRSHGVKCAIVTNSDNNKMRAVKKAVPEIETFFDAILTSEDFAVSKPDPDCYIKGAQRLGATWDECLIFEDAPSGLEAGQRSSICTIGVVGTLSEEELKNRCDYTITSFKDLSFDRADELLSKRKYVSDKEEKVRGYLDARHIPYTCYHHPEGKTIEEAMRWWHNDGSLHCKNIFLRNHKGDQHYLVCFSCHHELSIHDLEQRLKAELMAQGMNSPGKLSFASPERMNKYLQLQPGSVSPFGLINDNANHVILFLDEQLQHAPQLSFHPNDCRATLVIAFQDFLTYLEAVGNPCRFMKLY